MGPLKDLKASLLPSGQSLDLFVTLTDYYGYQQLVQIHDPPLIHELDHHHVLHFTYRRHTERRGRERFRARQCRRASPSPRARPRRSRAPSRRRGSWRWTRWWRNAGRRGRAAPSSSPRRFPTICAPRSIPTTASFPRRLGAQQPAVHAGDRGDPRPAGLSRGRSAAGLHRSRIPAPPERRGTSRVPGFFATLRGALSDIPSAQPVTDELGRVIEFNDQVRRLRSIIDSARPHVSELVAKVVTATVDRPISTEDVRAWREQVNSHVARDAGFAYQAYVRLKLASVRAFGAELIVKLRGVPAQSPCRAWWPKSSTPGRCARASSTSGPTARRSNSRRRPADHLPAWVKYLLAFDVKYRERRLHFLIEGQNRLYQLLGQDRFAGLNPAVVDRLKREFYAAATRCGAGRPCDSTAARSATWWPISFPPARRPARSSTSRATPRRSWSSTPTKLDQLIDRLAVEIDLNASTRELDDLLASLDPAQWQPDARREVLVNYLGFPFWDVLTFPVMVARQIGEINEILIDRISPQDAHALKGFDGSESLKGTGFGHFAAFLSRAYRENDYLLGRLHALDRLIDIVCDAAGLDGKVARSTSWR